MPAPSTRPRPAISPLPARSRSTSRCTDRASSSPTSTPATTCPTCSSTPCRRAAWRARRSNAAPAPATRLLGDGDVIDLGDRAFEVLHLPGHSPGSIGLWEAATGILFSGDAVYDGPLLDELDGCDIAAYVATHAAPARGAGRRRARRPRTELRTRPPRRALRRLPRRPGLIQLRRPAAGVRSSCHDTSRIRRTWRDGRPDGRAPGGRRPRRDRPQPHPVEGRPVGQAARQLGGPDAGRRGRRGRARDAVRRQRRRRALRRVRRRGRAGHDGLRGDPRRPHDDVRPAGPGARCGVRRAGRRLRRRPGVGRPGRRRAGPADRDVRRRLGRRVRAGPRR